MFSFAQSPLHTPKKKKQEKTLMFANANTRKKRKRKKTVTFKWIEQGLSMILSAFLLCLSLEKTISPSTHHYTGNSIFVKENCARRQ